MTNHQTLATYMRDPHYHNELPVGMNITARGTARLVMQNPAQIQLLLIEDNPGDRRLILEALHETNALVQTSTQYRLQTADRLDRGLETLTAHPPALVLLDLSLPDSSGLGTVVSFVAAAPEVAVVVLTGLDDEALAIKALHSGAQDYLVKGEISPSLLRRALPYAIERKRGEVALRESEQFAHATVNSLSAHIAILAADGTIIAVNRAWQTFAALNGGQPATTGVGANYLQVCAQASDAAQADAQAVMLGIREVQAGRQAQFELEYLCNGTQSERWFRVRVRPFAGGDPQRVVIAHEEITERKHAEARIERKVRHLAALRNIDIAIAAGNALAHTLKICVEEVLSQLGATVVNILVANPATQGLDYVLGRGVDATIPLHVHSQLGATLAVEAAHTQQVVQAPVAAGTFAGLPPYTTYSTIAVPLVAKDKVKGVLVLLQVANTVEEGWYGMLEALAGQAAIAIDSAELYEGLQRSNRELANAYDATIEGWSRALDLRDKETEGHCQRVTELTLKLARAAGLAEAELVQVRRGALLHDIGKMGIPDQILLKPGRLTEEEWVIMRRHPEMAVALLTPIAYLHPALDIPHYHHERWDGAGYPHGLCGEAIPLVARLFAVVDVWDALRSDRPYRPAWSEQEVFSHIRSLAGSHFDPAAVALFLTVMGGES